MRSRLKAVVTETILEAAEQVFAEQGLDARLETVAARAGVAVGTLYNHFTDRQALVDSLLEAHRANLRQRLEAVVERTQALPFRAQLEAVLEELTAVALPKLRLRMLLLQAMPHRLSRQAEARKRLFAVLNPMLERARKAGQLAPDPDGVQPVLLFGLVQATLSATQEVPAVLAPADVPRVVAQAFLDGQAGKKGRR